MLSLDILHPYTAWRLSCPLEAVTQPGTTVITATQPPDGNLLRTSVLRRADCISVTTIGDAAIVRVNAASTAAVQRTLSQLPTTRAVSREDWLALPPMRYPTWPSRRMRRARSPITISIPRSFSRTTNHTRRISASLRRRTAR